MDAAPAVAATRDVLSYLSNYRDRLFVLRIADDLIGTPLFPMLIKDIVRLQRMGIHTVLVPAARHAIDAALAEPAQHGVRNPAVGTRRVTPEADLRAVMVGATTVLNELLSLLTESGARAVVGNWVRARTLGVVDGIDYQRTGLVERIDTALLRSVLDTDAIPIVTNIGWNAVGKAYNISSIELAVEVAIALRAAKLFFVGTVAGVAKVPCADVELSTRPDGIYSSVDYRDARRLLDRCGDQFQPAVRELTERAVAACSGGVDRVHIIDGRADGILIEEIFSADGVGTMLYADQYIDIGAATAAEVPEIVRLIQPQVERGLLVPRTAAQVADRLADYVVYRVDDSVQGCAALSVHDSSVAEIESLVVADIHRGDGSGARLVQYLLERARARGAGRVVALTTQSADFFMELGFAEAAPDALPAGRERAYDARRASRVLEVSL